MLEVLEVLEVSELKDRMVQIKRRGEARRMCVLTVQ